MMSEVLVRSECDEQESSRSLERERRRERTIFLASKGSKTASEVLGLVRSLLEELRSQRDHATPVSYLLTLDVTGLPLVVEYTFFSEIAKVVGDFKDCYTSVEQLRIQTRTGIQEMLVKAAFALLTLPMPVKVEATVEE